MNNLQNNATQEALNYAIENWQDLKYFLDAFKDDDRSDRDKFSQWFEEECEYNFISDYTNCLANAMVESFLTDVNFDYLIPYMKEYIEEKLKEEDEN